MVQSPGRFWSMTIFGHRALAAIHSFPASPYLAMSRYHNFWDNKLRSAKVFVLNAGMLWSSKIGHNSPAMAYSYSLYHLFGQSSVCVFVSCVTVCPSVLVSVCLFVWLSVCMGAGTGVLMYTGPPLCRVRTVCDDVLSHTLGKAGGWIGWLTNYSCVSKYIHSIYFICRSILGHLYKDISCFLPSSPRPTSFAM